jgi:biotin carboxyl carrier protein
MARPQSIEILAEMVANVLSVSCAVGDTVTAIKVTSGDVVQEGDVLVVLG